RRRHGSTLASTTAINAPSEVPPRLKELHVALDGLKSSAANYVNLSRLQLALRGLEARDPVVRIAVLSLDDQKAARRLVRLLLADPLAPAGRWERELEAGSEDGRGILLRYGEENDIHPHNPLLRTVSVPSRILQKNKIEVLISSLNINVGGLGRATDADQPKDAVLVPTLQTPTSASGRVTLVTYPIHRAVIFGQGLQSCAAYGRFMAGQAGGAMPAETVKVAVGMPAPASEVEQAVSDEYAAIDVNVADEAVAKFRESIANSVFFERGWHRSGLPVLSKWLSQGATPTDAETLKPAIRNLVDSILSDADERIIATDAQRLQELLSSSIPEATRATLLDAVRIWAEQGHTELREQLDLAFDSKHWRKLNWWKLFWRVDDVGMIASEILSRRWLTEAEKDIIWVAGRIEEAGFFASVTDRPDLATITTPPTKQPNKTDEVASKHATMEPKPWPQEIPMARAYFSATRIPPLQALAQKLVVQTLVSTSATSALGALMWLSSSTTTVFEVGAVAALGAVLSLGRMQSLWERAREAWQGDVRETGRRALRETEESVRRIVVNNEKGRTDEAGVRERREAREAVGRAREALERVGGG
ncbi:hypothetical protein K490DRAFT_18170, partial [Saccharata proteae CBS 121410]